MSLREIVCFDHDKFCVFGCAIDGASSFGSCARAVAIFSEDRYGAFCFSVFTQENGVAGVNPFNIPVFEVFMLLVDAGFRVIDE